MSFMSKNVFTIAELSEICLVNNISILPQHMTVTNIKFGIFLTDKFWLTDSWENACYSPHEKVIAYWSKNVFICKSDCYTLTSFSANTRYLSVTGLKSAKNIKNTVEDILRISNLPENLIDKIVIESISCTFNAQSGLKKKILWNGEEDVQIFNYKKFSGIILKTFFGHVTYYNSGQCVALGQKNYTGLRKIFEYITDFFQMLDEENF